MPPKTKNTYKNDSKNIWFKSNKSNGYAYLSNFWPFCQESAYNAAKKELDIVAKELSIEDDSEEAFEVDGKSFASVEHYFHYAKYTLQGDEEAGEDIRRQATALDAKKRNTYHRHHSAPLDMAVWDQQRVNVMQTAIRAKFTQSKVLAAALLRTDPKALSEVPSRGGGVWDASGENALGVCLMNVREELKDECK